MKKLYILLFFFVIGVFLSFETSAQVNISTTTDSTCSNTLFDSGGSAGDYSNSENFKFTISPTGANTIDIVVDSIGLNDGDTLYFHDGADTTATLLFIATDTTAYIPPTISSTGGNITIQFISDADSIAYGWSLQWLTNLTTTPSVLISASTDTSCVGDLVTFNVTDSTGGGFDPVFQWYQNLTPVGSDLYQFSTTLLADQDSVWVEMTQASCPQAAYKAVSAAEITTVNSPVTASVSLAADTNFCAGTNITFTATPTNGGASPTYTWRVNGSPVVNSGPTYMVSTLVNGDFVAVSMASDIGTGCLNDSISADSLEVVVISNITASVSISVDDPSVCAGQTQLFTASPTNGGTTPTYSWRINGSPIVNSGATYSSGSLSDADNVAVSMASDLGGGCLIDSISADSIDVNINSNPSASISGSVDLLCPDIPTGTATAAGTGGNSPYTYQWNDPSTQSTAMAVGLATGTYIATVTDDSLCSDTVSVFIDSPLSFNISFSVTDVSTFGGSDGSITATVTGGTFIDNTGTINDGYDHSWSNGIITTNPRYVHTISSLSFGQYTDTITDDNSCIYFDSAIVNQPSQLVPGSIRIGGATSDTICDAEIVGLMTSASGATGGKGTLTYTWQLSTDLLNWANLPSSNSTSYNLNSTISEITFIRRAVSDTTFDTARSNILFLNYITPSVLSIIGLDASYCGNDDDEILFGSPTGPGTGYFSNSVWMDSITNTLDPKNLNASASGTPNPIVYNYLDQYGCFNTITDSTDGLSVLSALVSLPKSVYDTTDSVAVITSTYPYAGTTISGIGVYESDSVWYFDPSFASVPSTVVIQLEHVNNNGCVSEDSVVIQMKSTTMFLTTDLSDKTQFNSCYYDDTGRAYVVIPASDTVLSYRWLVYDYANGKYYLENGLNFTPDTIIGGDTLEFVFNPKQIIPLLSNLPYNQLGPTPAGVRSQLAIYFQHYTPNGFTNLFRSDFQTVNLVEAKITPDILNSNGTSSLDYQYCTTVDSVNFSSTVYPLGTRPTTKSYLLSNDFVGTALTNSPDGSQAQLNPDSAGVASGSITFTYTDDFSGCSIDTTYNLMVDSLPDVFIVGLDPDNCSNDGQIYFKGQPYVINKGNFSADTSNLLLNHPNGIDSASITASVGNVGSHYVEYTFTETTGCTNSDTAFFDIYDIPNVSVVKTNGDDICPGTNVVTGIRGYLDGAPAPPATPGIFTGSLFSDSLGGIVTDSGTGEAAYGPVSVNLARIDTIYFDLTDANGCQNGATTVIEVRALPPSTFVIDDSGNPDSSHICATDIAHTTTEFNNCPSCQVYWTNLSIGWFMDTNITDTINSRVVLWTAGELNPGPTKDSEVATGQWNYMIQTMEDNDANPGCTTEYIDSVFVDFLPQPFATIDTADLSGPNSRVCSNLGDLKINVQPASPGGTDASILTSSNMFTSSWSQSLDTVNQSFFVVSRDSMAPNTSSPFTRKVNFTYTYKEPTTNCIDNFDTSFTLKTAPSLSYVPPASTVFCPYDDSVNISLFVFNTPADTTFGSGIITGAGINGGITNAGLQNYKPQLFLTDTFPTVDLLKWVQTDLDGCVDSMEITGFTVKQQPILRVVVPPYGQEVCFKDTAFTLQPEYFDVNTMAWTGFTSLSGTNAPGDDNFFTYERDVTFTQQPYNGSQSKLFSPKWDSKDTSDGVRTRVFFTGTYAGNNGCTNNSDTVVISTRPEPVAGFVLDGACEKNVPVMHGNLSTLDTNNGYSNHYISSYLWEVNADRAWILNPADTLVDYTYYKLLSTGNQDFYLTAVSNYGCQSDRITKKIPFVESPEADFTWNMSDECAGDTVFFKDESKTPAGHNAITWNWLFGDGNTWSGKTGASNKYLSTQKFTVTLALADSTDCFDTVTKDIYIRPLIDSTAYNTYIDSFSLAYSGWTVWKQEYDEDLDDTATNPFNYQPSWFEHGEKTNGNITTMPGNKAWYLKNDTIEGTFDIVYQKNMQTSVIGPCFDMSLTKRPMLCLDVIYDLYENDGMVVQYTTDLDKPLDQVKWENVGDYFTENQVHYETGINWYEEENIFGNPGNQTDLQGKVGWTNKKDSWSNTRHDLDSVIGDSYVRFRVAFGSNSEGQEEGAIFDNFKIRERSKFLVYEAFTNTSQQQNVGTMDTYDLVVAESSDILDIQYHTSFPGLDPLNLDNTSDPGARSVSYGLSEVPYLQGDGSKYSDFISSPTFGSFTIKPRALEDPKFAVNMTFNAVTNTVTTEIVAVAEEFQTDPVDVTLQIALVEQNIDGGDVNFGTAPDHFINYQFKNTLKRLYPSAAGTSFNNMFKGDIQSVSTELFYENFYGSNDEFKVIAFVQDKQSQEIYQGNWVDINRTDTRVGEAEYNEIVSDAVEYKMYPNPTNGLTYMDFDQSLDKNYQLIIYDQLGSIVYQDVLADGIQRHSFDLNGLKAGMYFVMLNDGNHKVAIKKLMLTK